MSSVKWWLFCLGINVVAQRQLENYQISWYFHKFLGIEYDQGKFVCLEGNVNSVVWLATG